MAGCEQDDRRPSSPEQETAITFDDVFREFNRGISKNTAFHEALVQSRNSMRVTFTDGDVYTYSYKKSVEVKGGDIVVMIVSGTGEEIKKPGSGQIQEVSETLDIEKSGVQVHLDLTKMIQRTVQVIGAETKGVAISQRGSLTVTQGEKTDQITDPRAARSKLQELFPEFMPKQVVAAPTQQPRGTRRTSS